MTTAPVQSITEEQLAELQAKMETSEESFSADEVEPLIATIRQQRAALERLRTAPIQIGDYLAYQDAAGAIPVTGAGQSVGLLDAAHTAPTPAAQEPVAWRVSDPSEPESGHWLSDEPGTSWQRSEPLYTAPTAAEQPDRTTSDRYRAEPYDEVWEKARALGYGNVTMALADLERLMAAEQPGTLPVRRELLERTWAYYSEGEGELKDIALDCYALLAKEGEA